MRVRSLEDIVASDLCVGCGICQAIAGQDCIKMGIADDGFLRPVVTGDYSRSWNLIQNVCPGVAVRHERVPRGRSWDTLWGPILDLKAGYAADETIRWYGSSGGAISALLCHLLESGKAGYVLQIGANASNPLDNQVYLSQGRQGVVRCTGSRYAPAAPLTDIKRLLEQDDRRMAFVGKPCDVAALRAFLRFHPHVAPKVVCTLSFMCAGTPSMHATADVIAAMGADRARVVEFRYRGCGWPGQARAVMDDGTAYEMSYTDSWGKILGRRLQFRCKICADGVGELADVACGDAWYTEDRALDFEERPGRSLILCRTPMGRDVVCGAVDGGHLVTEAFCLRDVAMIQPYQAKRRRLVASRLFAMAVVGAPFPQYRGFHLIHNASQVSVGENGSSFRGMLYRLRGRPQYGHRFVFRLLTAVATVWSLAKRSV